MILRFIIFLSACITFIYVDAQNPLRFQKEVEDINLKNSVTPDKEVYLFTGSSSVRFWSSLASDFEGYNVVNTGFGGSTFPDLLHYQEQLIIQYQPKKVFIYEGDNDLIMDHTPMTVLDNAKRLAANLQQQLPEATIYFIAAKPSVARWEHRELYKEFNYSLQSWASFEEGVEFIDVWTPMCKDDGNVKEDLFISDNLHMNQKGYDIWTRVIRPFVAG